MNEQTSVRYNPCPYCKTTRHIGSLKSCLHDHTPTCNYILIGDNCNCNGPAILFRKCPECNMEFTDTYLLVNHHQTAHPPRGGVAKRVDRNIRYDILDPTFLEYMAKVADYGAKKYGNFNWHKSRLMEDKSPVNHMYKHLVSYQRTEPYDHPELGEGPEWHLIGIAFNAMMEFFYATTPKVPKGS